jgi:hypothetical protein
VQQHLSDLFSMFYPLDRAAKHHWAAILALPDAEYREALDEEARKRGLSQHAVDRAVAWVAEDGRQLMLLFRVPDPRDLDTVRRVYDTIAANDAPLAYAFVQQLPDGDGTWDIFHMSSLSYLAHCNRVSGPGADV